MKMLLIKNLKKFLNEINPDDVPSNFTTFYLDNLEKI